MITKETIEKGLKPTLVTSAGGDLRARRARRRVRRSSVSARPDERSAKAGDSFGPSSWIDVPQEKIDAFAEATGDDQWIHVDPERAQAGPFGTTIAHGYLTLSLIPVMSYEVVPQQGRMGINYGLNRVRFPAPVPVGSRLRGTFEVVERRGDRGWRTADDDGTVEREGGEKPVCVAEVVFRHYT